MGLSGVTTLVTGADGFIGSHLAERLAEAGAHVRALCMYNSAGSVGCLDDVPRDRFALMDVRYGDIRDQGFVRDLVSGVEVVFHLAALVSIPYSYAAPISFVETNVLGTANVLEAARSAGVRRVVHTSTSEVYGTPLQVPITETHPLRAQSPYSASKIAADQLCEAYARSFDLPVVILRPFNTYGPRQSTRAVIPTILFQLLADNDIVSLGSLRPQRDFTFVTDTVAGFVAMADSALEPGEIVQLGTGRAISVADLFELCCQVVGRRAEVRADPDRIRPRRSEVDVLLSDPARARERLQWAPTVELQEGVTRTAHWLGSRMDLHRAPVYQ